MLLEAEGYRYEPGYLECLTLVGIGASHVVDKEGSFYFFGMGLPDRGISLALHTLGFEFTEIFEKKSDEAAERAALAILAKHLKEGPVIAGPLDMGFLSYNPDHRFMAGADHFVLVYGLEGEEVLLHDPAGFPGTRLSQDKFMLAWKARRIGYKDGHFRMWSMPRKVSDPSPVEIFDVTDRTIAARYLEAENWKHTGAPVIRELASKLEAGISEHLWGFLTHFALPLGAKRALDYARFFAPYDPERTRIKAQQATCFGEAHAALQHSDILRARQALLSLAQLEELFARLSIQKAALVTG
jgi:hypothetical protein